MSAALALPALAASAPHADLRRGHKRILQIYLQGGVSQFESWDPKPGTLYGGPFRAIETSVPGMRICELLPHTAQRMHHLSLVRSVNLKTNDHGVGRKIMERGRRQEGYPYVGAVAAKYFAPTGNPLPGYIHISTRGGGLRGQAGAASLGIARALTAYNPELRGALKKGGFLTRDAREKERKKYGLAGARKRFQFSKR